MLSAKYKLGNLVAIMDRNFIQIDGRTEDIMPLEPMGAKYKAFNWEVVEIDGNDMADVVRALDGARDRAASGTATKPLMIIANTVPGKGVSFMENKFEWHGKTPNEDEARKAIAELERNYKKTKTA